MGRRHSPGAFGRAAPASTPRSSGTGQQRWCWTAGAASATSRAGWRSTTRRCATGWPPRSGTGPRIRRRWAPMRLELARLRRKVAELELERGDPEKSRSPLRAGAGAVSRVLTCEFIAAEKTTYGERRLCRVTGISPTTFYALAAPPPPSWRRLRRRRRQRGLGRAQAPLQGTPADGGGPRPRAPVDPQAGRPAHALGGPGKGAPTPARHVRAPHPVHGNRPGPGGTQLHCHPAEPAVGRRYLLPTQLGGVRLPGGGGRRVAPQGRRLGHRRTSAHRAGARRRRPTGDASARPSTTRWPNRSSPP